MSIEKNKSKNKNTNMKSFCLIIKLLLNDATIAKIIKFNSAKILTFLFSLIDKINTRKTGMAKRVFFMIFKFDASKI